MIMMMTMVIIFDDGNDQNPDNYHDFVVKIDPY